MLAAAAAFRTLGEYSNLWAKNARGEEQTRPDRDIRAGRRTDAGVDGGACADPALLCRGTSRTGSLPRASRRSSDLSATAALL
jgi:hypothetical protein